MKIIKKEDTSNWKYLHTCVKCDSELEVDKLDIVYNHNRNNDTFTAKCAVCSDVFNIENDKISKLLKIEIIKCSPIHKMKDDLDYKY